MSIESQVGGAMGWSVAVRVVRFALGIASSILIVRSLGAGTYGVLSVLRMILAFVTAFASFGLAQAILRFVPEMKPRPADVRRLLVLTSLVQAVSWLLCVAVAVAAGGWLSHVLGVDLRPYLFLGVALTSFELSALILGHSLNAYYDVKTQAVAALVSSALFLGTLVAGLAMEKGIVAVLVAGAAGHAGTAAVLLPALARRLRVTGAGAPAPAARAGSSIPWGRLARYALPFGLISVLNLVTWRQSETLVLAHFWSPREVGLFDLAYKLPQLVLEFIPLAVWPLVLAGYSEVYAADPSRAGRVVDKYYRLLFVLGAPISMLGALVCTGVIPLLYGEEFRPAAPLCAAFFLVFPLTFFGTPLSMSLYVLERTVTILLIYLASAVVNVGLDLLLIPRHWQIGSIVPTSLVVVLTPFVYARVLSARGFAYTIPWRFIGRAYAASASCFLLWPLRGLMQTLPGLALFGAMAGLVVLLAFRVVRVVGPLEMDLIRRSRFPMSRALVAILGGEGRG